MISAIETFLLISVASLYIVHVPFNKVEESFNTQAVHDVVNIFPNNLPSGGNATAIAAVGSHEAVSQQHQGSNEIAQRSHLPWDHTLFPGVVPRTFVGAFLVGLPLRLCKSYVLNGLLADDDSTSRDEHDLSSQFIMQLASRLTLLSFLAISMGVLLRAIGKRYGLEFRMLYLLVTVSQFHYLFYASRFLPNTYAAILANLVFASWINRQYSKSIIYIAFCVVIFRFDTAIFFGLLLLDGVFIRRFLSLSRVLMVGIPAGLVAIAVTFTVDSILWARPVWPELEGLYFNAWLNKSHEWGTQPFFWYIYSCIPRMMLTTCVPMILADNKITRDYFIPVLAFMLAYSLLPHKELRFVLFIVPLLNLCATSGLVNVRYYMDKFCQYLDRPAKEKAAAQAKSSTKPRKSPDSGPSQKPRMSFKRKLSYLTFLLFTLCFFLVPNFLACFVLSRISSHNYPGGQAALSLGVTKELLDEAKVSLESFESLRGDLKDVRSSVAVYVNNLAAQTGLSRFVQVDGVYYSKAPHLDATTFAKGYQLIYLLLEPKEVPEFIRDNCALDENRERILKNGASQWRKTNDELKCRLPNQAEMFCSIADSISSFSSVNIGGLLRNLRQARSLQMLASALDDASYIKLRTALHIIRCGTTSKLDVVQAANSLPAQL